MVKNVYAIDHSGSLRKNIAGQTNLANDPRKIFYKKLHIIKGKLIMFDKR